ncbi:MAG: hypothetical protein NTV61_07245 [Candidatus Bathyarchaeota archaeon]|nr:hypothetical protein [Candidatus Bathyarchaeota archaeon]
MYFSQRRTNLLRVLEIESKIKDIEHGDEYLRVKREIKVLENAHGGGGILTVTSPDDINEVVELRKNSVDVANYLTKYKGKMQTVMDRIDLLNDEKSKLKSELFKPNS